MANENEQTQAAVSKDAFSFLSTNELKTKANIRKLPGVIKHFSRVREKAMSDKM